MDIKNYNQHMQLIHLNKSPLQVQKHEHLHTHHHSKQGIHLLSKRDILPSSKVVIPHHRQAIPRLAHRPPSLTHPRPVSTQWWSPSSPRSRWCRRLTLSQSALPVLTARLRWSLPRAMRTEHFLGSFVWSCVLLGKFACRLKKYMSFMVI